MSAAASDRSVDGLTIDAMGCLVALRDPVPVLRRLVREDGVERSPVQVAAALRAEIAYYRSRHLEGRDPTSLRALQRVCATLFLRELDVDRPVDDAFLDRFLAALDYVPVAGAIEALRVLHAADVPMVCVSNWDSGLEHHLQRLGIARYLRGTVSSGTAGYAKPDPRIFAPALRLLGLPAARVAHLGDEAGDRDGAAAAGLAFFDPPVATLPERLGIERPPDTTAAPPGGGKPTI